MVKIIKKVVKQLDDAFNQGNLEEVLSFYSETAAVVIEPDKVVMGKPDIRKAFEQAMKLNGRAKQLKTNVIQTDDTALFTSKWIFEWVVDGELKSRESIATTVFRKDKLGNWKIIIDNSLGPAVLI